jgi:diguanylate cyclase (GGDEF)-like protein
MAWQAVVGLNLVTAACYFGIATLILLGLLRTRQMSSNPLALATAAIFTTCGVHHGHHALHLMISFSNAHAAADVVAVRNVFGEWHSILIDLLGAAVAVTYLGLRRSYKALLNTPSMFDDAVRLAAERRLREVAFTDQLTGIPNRAAYQQLADRLAETDETVTVAFVDLDRFKAVNDRYGHDAGDQLLRAVAQRLSRELEAVGAVFRLGGDEFVLVARGDRVGPNQLAAQVQNVLVRPFELADTELVVGASIGVASGAADAGVDRMLRQADADMYAIKARREVPLPRQVRIAGIGAPG